MDSDSPQTFRLHSTLLPAASYAASRYCFWRRLCVRLSVRTPSRKLLIRNWCNSVGIWNTASARSVWKMMTFDNDLWPWEIIFIFFATRATTIQWLDLAISFSVWRCIFTISISLLRAKVTGTMSRSWQAVKNGYAQVCRPVGLSNIVCRVV